MSVLGILVSIASCGDLPAWACDAQAKTGLDARLLYAVCMVETHGDTAAVTPKDGHTTSFGVCQIKLRTAQYVGFKGTEKELMDPHTNAVFAARYISYHLRRQQDLQRALSAYNAGRPITANKKYVKKVMSRYTVLVAGGEQ